MTLNYIETVCILMGTCPSCDVQMRKPDKEIYLLAENKARVEPDEILFIDDSKSSIQAAKEMGWQTVLFETYDPERSIKEIKKKLEINQKSLPQL